MSQTGPVSWEDFLDSQFQAAGQRTGIDPYLLRAIAMRESSLIPNSLSTYTDPNTGEAVHHYGLMQLSAANQQHYNVTNPFDPGQNILGGAMLLRDNLKMYDGDLGKALQQYNGGSPLLWGKATRAYVQDIRNNYQALTGQNAPEVLPQFIQTMPPPALRPIPAAATPTDQPVGPPTPPSEQAPIHSGMNADPSIRPNPARSQADPLAAVALPKAAPAANRGDMQSAFNLASRASVPLPQPSGQSPSPFVRAFLANAIYGGGPAGAKVGSMLGLDPYSLLQNGGASNGSSAPYPYAATPDVRPGGRGGR